MLVRVRRDALEPVLESGQANPWLISIHRKRGATAIFHYRYRKEVGGLNPCAVQLALR